MNPCERPGTPATGDDVSPGLARCDRALLETSGCSLSVQTARTLYAASLTATCYLHVLVGGVSESPLAAMHRGEAAAILGTRMECERGNVEAGRDR